MTMVGQHESMLPAMLQLAQQIRERKRQQAAALIGTLKPGETLDSVPGAVEAFKRLTGQQADPNRVLTEITTQQILDKVGVTALSGMTPEQQTGLAKNKIYNDVTGTTGTKTDRSYAASQRVAETEGKTAEVTASTGLMSAEATRKALAQMTPEERVAFASNQIINTAQGTTGAATRKSAAAGRATAEATGEAGRLVTEAATRGLSGIAPESESERTARLIGERQMFGRTGAETEADAAKATAETKLSNYASKFLDDPTNSAWGHLLKQNGLNPVAVTEAFATGQGTVLGGIFDVKTAKLALQGKQLEVGQEVDKARIRAAEDMSKGLGGRLGIRTILSLENAVEGGNDPFKIGVASGDVAMWLKARELGAGAYVNKAITENNPQAAMIKQLIDNQKTFAGEPDQLTALNSVVGQLTASMLAEADLGMPRPGPDAPKELRDEWDKRARFHYGTLGMIGKTPGKLFGLDLGILTPDASGVTANMPFMNPQNEVTTGAPADASKVSTTPRPKFFDPDAARAASAALGMMGDSTLIRKPK